MKKHFLLFSVPVVLLIACSSADSGPAANTSSSSSSGGAANESAPPSDVTAAVPTLDEMSLSMTQDDVAAGRTTAGDQGCHPHLFARSRDAIRRFNRHAYRGAFLHIEAAAANIAHAHVDAAGTTWTWTQTETAGVLAGVTRRVSVTKNADASYALTLSLAASTTGADAAAAIFTPIATGTTSALTGGRQLTLAIDFTALRTVIPAEKASGKLSYTVAHTKGAATDAGAVLGEKRTVAVQATSFAFDDDAAANGVAAAQSRTGTLNALMEPGVGGYVKYADQLLLACPANPAQARANVSVVARWYTNSAGAFSARADAMGTGGQIDVAEKWMSMTCARGATGSAPVEAYWAMKTEVLATGVTATGLLKKSSDDAGNTGTNACDAQFGATMSVDDSTTDFNFTATPTVLFPGQF